MIRREQVEFNLELAKNGHRSQTPPEIMAELCQVYLDRMFPKAPWQAIDTAPKDGTQVLTASRGGKMAVNQWHGDGPEAGWAASYSADPWTHWMPRPELPVFAKRGELQ